MSGGFYIKKFKKGIIVAPAKIHIKKLTDALYFFSYHDPKMFRKFRSMKAILVYPGKGSEREYGFHGDDKIWVCHSRLVRKSSVSYLASTLVHETWHLIQYDRGSKNYGDRAEKGAYKKQREFLVKVGNKEAAKWLDSEFKEKWWLYKMEDDKETLYFPSLEPLKKFIEDYKKGKLKIKKTL